MSSFTHRLEVSPMPDGGTWQVTRPFSYHVGTKYSRRIIRITRNFPTDFASIPKWLQWPLPYWAKYHKGAVLHDYLYRTKQIAGKPITRKKADLTFKEAMKVDWRNYRYRYLMADLEYVAVRLFGFKRWKEKR